MTVRASTRWLALAVALLVAAGLLVFTGSGRQADVAEAQAAGGSDMFQRVEQIARILEDDKAGPAAHSAAIDSFFDVIWANMRILPSPGVPETEAADQAIAEAETRMAEALEEFIRKGKSDAVKDDALDVKLLLEEMNEVARAVGEITRQCGEGQDLSQPPCDQLQPLLDEETGQELVPGQGPGGVIGPGFSVKLRGPFVPAWFASETWQEDVRVTDAIAPGECAVIFKETTGLMLRLRFVRIIIVNDPWVSVFGVPRGTAIPIWVLEWVPAEYGKEWNICNQGGQIVKTITQRVVQDIPLNYFWRYYPKDP